MMSQQGGTAEDRVREATDRAMRMAVEQGSTSDVTLPSNVEVAESLESLKVKDELPPEKISDTGKELVDQVERLAEHTKRIFLDKNRDEHLQKAALHASRAAQIARRHQLVSTKEGEAALEEARQGLSSGLHLARLIVLSAEFRDELADGIGIIVDSLRATPRSSSSSSSKKGQGTTTTTTGHGQGEQGPLGQQGQQWKQGQQQQQQGGTGELERMDEVGWGSEEDEDEEEEGGGVLSQGQQQVQAGGEGLAQKAGDVTQALTGGKWKGGSSSYQALSQEQQDKLADRFYSLMVKLQRKPEYQSAVSFLLDKVRSVQEKGGLHAERMEKQLTETGPGRAFTEEMSRAKDHAVQLVENWMEGSLDPLFTHINDLSNKLQSDEETRRELRHLAHFVETCLRSPEVLGHEDNVKREAKQRFNAVRERLLREYDEPVTRLKDELTMIRNEIREDEAAQLLQRDVSDLVKTILYDDQGQATVKVELLHDLEYILSAFIRRVQFIPVPRVAVTTPDMDFVADGMVLNLRELTPKQMHLETLTKVHDKDLEQGKPVTETSGEPIELETFVRVHLTGITADLKDVHWYYNKKTGMFQEHDRGRADFKVYGRGLCIDLDLQPTLPVPTQDHPVAHSLEVLSAKAKIHRMGLRVYDSKHDWVYAMFKPMLKSRIKQAMEKAVEDYMKDYLQRLDRDTTMSMAGEYPVTKGLHVDKKQTGTITTSTSGAQAQDKAAVVSEADLGVGWGDMPYLPASGTPGGEGSAEATEASTMEQAPVIPE